MALTLGDNFSYQGAKPLDARLVYSTVASMKAVADSTMYDGCMAYCVATDKTYQWKSTNTVDPDTGKWSEYSSGGGHEIKNNGVAVTERGVMNFTDFDIADDSTNEETDVKAHRLTSAEIADICTPLPGAVSDMPVLFDERETEYVVGWYVLANGTKKPVYEKAISDTLPETSGDGVEASKNISLSASIDKVVSINAMRYISSTGSFMSFPITNFTDNVYKRIVIEVYNNSNATPNRLKIVNSFSSSNGLPFYATIQYTKNTDTPV